MDFLNFLFSCIYSTLLFLTCLLTFGFFRCQKLVGDVWISA